MPNLARSDGVVQSQAAAASGYLFQNPPQVRRCMYARTRLWPCDRPKVATWTCYLSSEPDPALFPASLARRVVLPHLQQVAARPHSRHPSIDIGFRGACPHVSVRSSPGGFHPGSEADWEAVLRGHNLKIHVS